MKAKPRKQISGGSLIVCEPGEATHVEIRSPAPGFEYHLLPIRGKYDGPNDSWEWNEDTERPTLKPSIRCRYTWKEGEPGEEKRQCHSYVTDGKIQFLSDSTHSLAGQTVDLLDIRG